MRHVTLAALTIAALVGFNASSSRAEVQYPWCAQYRSQIGATNCGFVTYRQCLETISGVGGICTRNPAYRAPPRSQRRSPPMN